MDRVGDKETKVPACMVVQLQCSIIPAMHIIPTKLALNSNNIHVCTSMILNLGCQLLIGLKNCSLNEAPSFSRGNGSLGISTPKKLANLVQPSLTSKINN